MPIHTIFSIRKDDWVSNVYIFLLNANKHLKLYIWTNPPDKRTYNMHLPNEHQKYLSFGLYSIHYDVGVIYINYTFVGVLNRCYVAVCNNYAICNTLQTALNCNAVCNTSYFKLRCEGNAICNVLQIASKFYHLKILKRRIKNDQLQNASLQ